MFESLTHRHTLALGVGTALTVGALAFFQGPGGNIANGRELFDRNFHVADGLGTPDINADSCRACHQDPGLGGAGGLELNVTRFANDNGGAGPFQNLPGGQILSKLRSPDAAGREEHPTAGLQADVFEQRQTPTLFGLGLIDTISGPIITANEDPTDANNDGIFGVARRLTIGGSIEIGRLGWKAQVPTIEDFVRDAMGQEMGITTASVGRGFAVPSDSDGVPDPELDQTAIDDLTAFIASLPAPARGGSTDPRLATGEQLFNTVGCAVCHIPTLQGSAGPVPLYSNLLLHNVMPAGFRGMAEPGADVGFYRTPPLWGIRDTAPYMHDGRAETIVDAIKAHDGEAAAVTAAFQALSPQDVDALLVFLEDL